MTEPVSVSLYLLNFDAGAGSGPRAAGRMDQGC